MQYFKNNIYYFCNQTNWYSNKLIERMSVPNLVSMVWSQFSWSELFCLFKTCLPGTGNDFCHYGCWCGLGNQVSLGTLK